MSSSIRYILTHPGSAHKDDFLACSVLADVHQVAIVRREPTEQELDAPDVCVVDVGGRHEPELNNFDHHQFDRDSEPACAITLVLKHLGVYESARQFCEWLEPAEWFDTRGPVATAGWLGVEREVLARLNSPIDVTLLRRFALSDKLEPGEPLWQIMQYVGEDMLSYVRSLKDRMRVISRTVQFWEIPESGGLMAVYLPRTDAMPKDPSMGLARYVEQQISEKGEVAAMIYPDRRGEGYGLSRYNDHPKLEFTLIDGEADVHFAHARGFVAKTSATSTDRLMELLKAALLK